MIFWAWEQWRVVRGPGISIRTLTYNRSHRGVCVRSAQLSPYTHSRTYTCADGWGKRTWQWCIATGCRCRREERDSTSHGWVGEREGCEPQERGRERCSVGNGTDTPRLHADPPSLLLSFSRFPCCLTWTPITAFLYFYFSNALFIQRGIFTSIEFHC